MNHHRQISHMLYDFGRRSMVEGVLQGYDRLTLSDLDGEYTSYAKEIMEGVTEGAFSNLEEFTDFLSKMRGLDLDTNLVCLADLSRMIWNIIHHDVKEAKNG